MSKIDLHMHSIYSDDGEFDVKTLVHMCHQKGMTHFAITDHNSVKAIDEAQAACQAIALEEGTGSAPVLIAGVELDCTFEGVNLHLLGYGMDHANPIFHQIEQDILLQEQHGSRIRLEKVRALGIPFSDIEIQALSRDGVVTGEAIAEAAMAYDTLKENPLLQPYYKNGPRSDNPYLNFYWDFCSQGKPAYVPIDYINLEQAIEVIVKNGGIAVLAHPGNNIKENINLLEKIIHCGIQGLEVFSSYHSKNQVNFYKDVACKHGLLMTSGSDFHGKIKPSIQIGDNHCDGLESLIITELGKSLMDSPWSR